MLEQMSSVRSADGTQIAFSRTGVGPPLVLVHGSADDHTCWTGLLPSLTERFSVYTPDRRGRGESQVTNTTTYAIEREFEDMRAVVDAIGEPVHLLGHSYGALCALEAALQSSNVKSLVLYEPPFWVDAAESIIPPGTLEELERLLTAGERETAALVFVRKIARLKEYEIEAVRSSPAWQIVIETAPTILHEVRAVESYTFDPVRLSRLSTPTLLLMGSDSPPFLKAATEALATTLPNSRVVVFEGQGHLATHTSPDLFLNEVVQFLTDV